VAVDAVVRRGRPRLITKSQLLRSRGWRPDGLGFWSKRGWDLGLEDAFALESIMEREYGALTPRCLYAGRMLAELREKIRREREANA